MNMDIKPILSVLLAIAVAFSSMGVLTSGIEDTVSFDMQVIMDPEQVLALSGSPDAEIPGETRESVKMAADMIGAVTLQGVATRDSAELDLLAGDNTVLSFGLKNGENGTTFATSLLSSDVILVPAEIIEKAQEQMTVTNVQSPANSVDLQELMKVLQSLDRQQIAKDAGEINSKLKQSIEARKGGAEAGEYTVDGLSFTGKAPVEMTYVEFTELLLSGVKELAAKDSLKPLIRLTGEDFEAEIDRTTEELKNQPETDHPDRFELSVYTNTKSDAYYVCDMIRSARTADPAPAEEASAAQNGTAENSAAAEEIQEESMHIAFGAVDKRQQTMFSRAQGEERMLIRGTRNPEGAISLEATVLTPPSNAEIRAKRNEAGAMDMLFTVRDGKQDARISVKTEKTGERTGYVFAACFGDTEEPMVTIKGSAGKGGRMISAFEGENLTVVPVERLMDAEDLASGQLQVKLLAGVMKAITVFTVSLPKDTAAWVNSRIREAMNPGTTPTAQPEAEPATEGE